MREIMTILPSTEMPLFADAKKGEGFIMLIISCRDTLAYIYGFRSNYGHLLAVAFEVTDFGEN